MAERAIDGNVDGRFFIGRSTTHTLQEDHPWWEVDLGSSQPLDRIKIWNRTDETFAARLANYKVSVLDEARQVVWERQSAEAPNPTAEFRPSDDQPGAATALGLALASHFLERTEESRRWLDHALAHRPLAAPSAAVAGPAPSLGAYLHLLALEQEARSLIEPGDAEPSEDLEPQD